MLKALIAEGFRLFESESATFLVPAKRFQAPTFPPPFRWKNIDLSVDIQVWGDFPDSRVPTAAERQTIATEVLRRARPVPLTVPFDGDANGMARVSVQLTIDIHRFRSSARDESFIAILGMKGGSSRLIYGEMHGATCDVVWDSPLFEGLRLEAAYGDLDGDGADEILLWTKVADRYWTSQLVAFTRTGVELTRQAACDIDPLDGYDATGGACPIIGQEIEVPPATKGARDLFVQRRNDDDSFTKERYVLVRGRYVKRGRVR